MKKYMNKKRLKNIKLYNHYQSYKDKKLKKYEDKLIEIIVKETINDKNFKNNFRFYHLINN